jgi:serine/threonine-protein kinase
LLDARRVGEGDESAPQKAPPAPGRFGEIAIRLGLLTTTQVEEAIEVQSRQRRMLQAAGSAARDLRLDRLGEVLQRLGYLNEDGIRRVLNRQAQERQAAEIARAPNRRIGDFELLRKLGQGSMGTVYLVRQLSQNRPVALKILPPDLAHDHEFLERFRREARAASRLSHPHIVTAYDVGVAAGYHYIAMEYVEGENLEKCLEDLRDGRYPPSEVLQIAKSIGRALARANAAGIVHRDIKPSNILRDRNGMYKLTDLGLASRKGPDKRVTSAGTAVGTPYYLSPEQARGEINVDLRADIYSLGATLYHLATGEVPFPGRTAVEVMTRHITQPLRPPNELVPDIPKALSRLIEKMMAKRPEDRQQSPEELLDDIARVERGEIPLLKRVRFKPKSQNWGQAAPPAGGPAEAARAGLHGSRHPRASRHPAGSRRGTGGPFSTQGLSPVARRVVLWASVLLLAVLFGLLLAQFLTG